MTKTSKYKLKIKDSDVSFGYDFGALIRYVGAHGRTVVDAYDNEDNYVGTDIFTHVDVLGDKTYLYHEFNGEMCQYPCVLINKKENER